MTQTLTLTLEAGTEGSSVRHTAQVSFPDAIAMRGVFGDLRLRTAQAVPPILLQLCGLLSWISAGVKSRWA